MTRVARKGRIVHAALLVAALWPAVQLALVWRYDVSPWKLGGWGMYAAPRFGLIGMEIYGRASAADPWRQLAAPSPGLQAAATDFLERHRWLRRLASSRGLEALVRVEQPRWRTVRIVVSYPVLDRTTGMVVLTADERLSGP